MLEYIEQLLQNGVHLPSAPERKKNGKYELVITNSNPKAEICIRMEKLGVEKSVTEFRITEVLRMIGTTSEGEKMYQNIELPGTTMFRKNIKYKREMNAFATPGILSF